MGAEGAGGVATAGEVGCRAGGIWIGAVVPGGFGWVGCAAIRASVGSGNYLDDESAGRGEFVPVVLVRVFPAGVCIICLVDRCTRGAVIFVSCVRCESACRVCAARSDRRGGEAVFSFGFTALLGGVRVCRLLRSSLAISLGT